MGILDSLLGKPAKPKLNPQSEASKFGQSFLLNDLNWNPNQALPQQNIAGLSGRQEDIQTNIYDQANQGGRGYNLAIDHAENTLRGGFDPNTSQYYQGFRDEVNDLRDASNERLSRQSQLGGTVGSTPSQGIAAENNRRYDDLIAREMGRLAIDERGRQDNAANTAAGLDQQRFGQNVAADQAIVKQQVIEQMRNDAIYKQAYDQLMFQYNVLAPTAQNLLSYTPGVSQQGGSQGLLSQGLGIASAVTGIAGGISQMGANKAQTNFYNNQAIANQPLTKFGANQAIPR